MKIHDTQITLNDIQTQIDFMASMYLTGGVKVAPIHLDTIFQSFKEVRFALDTLEAIALSNPNGKNVDSENYLPWEN